MYQIAKGTEYTYEVSKDGYKTATGPLRLDENVTMTVPVALEQESSSGGSTSKNEVTDGSIITSGGTYYIKDGTEDATITVMTRGPLTIVGKGIEDQETEMFSDITIDCVVSGVDLTLEDVWIKANVGQGTASGATNFGRNILNFTGSGNELHVSGENLL